MQRASARSEHLEALRIYDRIPRKRVTVEAAAAAARSAWALSLPDRAIAEFERAIELSSNDPQATTPLMFSRAIIEFQEARYQEVAIHAEETIEALPQGHPLRSRLFLLWGQSLVAQSNLAQAEQKFERALTEASPGDIPEMNFALATCQRQLGKFFDARKHFEAIPGNNERAPEVIRQMAEMALEARDFATTKKWLTKGRSAFPDAFLDSWVDYALGEVAISEKNKNVVREITKQAVERFPPSDPWLALLQAAAEANEW